MLEMLTGVQKKADLPEPTGDIQGIIQNMGTITGLPYKTMTYRNTVQVGGITFFAPSGRIGSNSANSATVHSLSLDTNTATSFGSDKVAGYIDRAIILDQSGSNIYLYAGNGTGGMRVINSTTGAFVADNSNSQNVTDHTSGVLGSGTSALVYLVSPTGAVYKMTGTTGLSNIGNKIPTNSGGFVGCQYNNKLLVKARDTSTTRIFDLSTEVVTSAGNLAVQTWCDGVFDGETYVYFVTGTKTLINSLRRYNVVSQAWDTTYSPTFTGDVPANWGSQGTMLCWYKKAIYMWRCDTDTPAGRTLYRII